MAHKTISRVGPKRKIEKQRSSSTEISTTSVLTNTVFTADDAVTLVRSILTVSAMPRGSQDVDIENVTQFLLHILPGGTSVLSPTVAEVLDANVSRNEIIRDHVYAFQNAVVQAGGGSKVTIDSKGMRKLDKGDKIGFDHTSLETLSRINWTLLLIFKQ